MNIDTADTILHKPSGEKWLVAYARSGYVCCCGWPESLAPASDCELLEKASEEDRLALLRQMADSRGGNYDSRTSYARNYFHELAETTEGAGI